MTFRADFVQEFDLTDFRARPLPDEQTIMASWQGDITRPVVSIICISFNHALYIEDAIRGFLIQKTGFPFEIILHDDASTDATQQIIRWYHEKYPNLIKPVLHQQNQYSQGKKPAPLATTYSCGDYLALCEGDDFWIDGNKLAAQYAAVQSAPGCRLCFHPAYHGGESSSPTRFRRIINDRLFYPRHACVLSPWLVIAGAGNFVPTASLFIKRSVIDEMPGWFRECPVGDYFIQVLGSVPDGAAFIPTPMSCYRIGAAGSWTGSQKSAQKIRHWQRMRKSVTDMQTHIGQEYRWPVSFLQANDDEFFFGSREIPLHDRVKAFDDSGQSTTSLSVRLVFLSRRLPGALALLAALPYKARLSRVLYLGGAKLLTDIMFFLRSGRKS